ncbi:cytochrome P450 [Colletotrichum eremochloae]|nr:cytochrome P450 [Colletotrichum eremochloae]
MLVVILSSYHHDSIPTLNAKGIFEFSSYRAKQEFVVGAKPMMTKWFQAHPDKPARVIADVSKVILLPLTLMDEVRNNHKLSFMAFVHRAFHADLPGFEGFAEGPRNEVLFSTVINKDLTKHLNKVTEPLTEETALAVKDIFGDNPDWVSMPLRDASLRLVARISSQWLKVTSEYANVGFRAGEALRMWPKHVRPIVNWFLPECKQARQLVADARRIMKPVLEERQRQKREGRTFDDAIEWMERESKGKYYDPAGAQLLLSIVAIHTTTDLLNQTLADLTAHPETFELLRKEIITELGEGGWKKTTLYNMKLLDSVLKESQRLKPIGTASMRRVAQEDIKFSDGTFVRKGEMIAMPANAMWDSKVYEKPDTWDARRFLQMRETPGKENLAHFVATSPIHLGFGHGMHACPGRFFASNELKIALIHLLMKYDWRLPDGTDLKLRPFGFSLGADPAMKLEFRRRKEDISI